MRRTCLLKHRSYRGHKGAGSHGVGSQRGQWSDQHHHKEGQRHTGRSWLPLEVEATSGASAPLATAGDSEARRRIECLEMVLSAAIFLVCPA